MTERISIWLIILAVFVLPSCEKVIDYDLQSADPVIVIEATVTSNNEPFNVLISKTTPYFGASESSLVQGAKVSIKTENGKPRYFNEISPGVYQLNKFIAPPKNWYIINIENEGITYTAKSYLNNFVPIVDCNITYFEGLGFFDSGYKINCFIKDPPDVDNYYRLKLYKNGKTVNTKGEMDIYTDRLFDGKTIGLMQNSSVVFDITDTVIVELQSIDKAAYDYFSTLEGITGLEFVQSASPSNPISNFNNGALGYFSAYSYDRKTVIISNYTPSGH